jgi:hypothetical protein
MVILSPILYWGLSVQASISGLVDGKVVVVVEVVVVVDDVVVELVVVVEVVVVG